MGFFLIVSISSHMEIPKLGSFQQASQKTTECVVIITALIYAIGEAGQILLLKVTHRYIDNVGHTITRCRAVATMKPV
jgi:hypothetical protein